LVSEPIDNSNPTLLPAEPEQRIRELLAQGKWRKARDEAKPLAKADKARYLPLLIQANLGLARDMTAKGQISEAHQVLAYLATIAPPEQIRALDLEVAGPTPQALDRLTERMALLADPAGKLPEEERLRHADQVVLAFAVPPMDNPAQEALAGDVRAIHAALEAVSAGQSQRAPELLRPISHRSPFSHWAAFARGVAAFHTADLDRAARFFDALPPKSVPGKAGLAYQVLSGRTSLLKDKPRLAELATQATGRLLGQPHLGKALIEADRQWREGQHVKSYCTVREALPEFPAADDGPLGTLSEFYFQAPHTMSFDDREDYLDFFAEMLADGGAKGKIEEMRSRRLLALEHADEVPGKVKSNWEGFILAHEALYGPNRRLASMAYTRLGKELSMTRSDPGPFGPHPGRARLRDAKGARESLLKAIELDPGNLPAYLQLSAIYGALNQRSERNRLLDHMVKRFPEEKQVLLEAAAGCFLRKAFIKGLEYLAHARRLDRLDPHIPEVAIQAHRSLARQQFQKAQLAKARQTLAATNEFLTDEVGDLRRSRWTALVWAGVLEQLFGDTDRGQESLERGRALGPFAGAFLLFTHLVHRCLSPVRSFSSPFLPALRDELRPNAPRGWALLPFLKPNREREKQAPTIADSALLAQILRLFEHDPQKPALTQEVQLLREYLNAAIKQPFTRPEALALSNALDIGVFREQVSQLAKAMLRRDPADPLFSFMDFTLGAPWALGPEAKRQKLQSILDEARRRGDSETARSVQHTLKDLSEPPLPPSPFPDEPDFEDEEDDDFEDDFDDSGPPHFSFKEAEQIEAIMEDLAHASKDEIRRLRNTVFKGMPPFIVDALVKAAKTGQRPFGPGPSKRPWR
jgi:tetratricopeptide (TPR) repeat protein